MNSFMDPLSPATPEGAALYDSPRLSVEPTSLSPLRSLVAWELCPDSVERTMMAVDGRNERGKRMKRPPNDDPADQLLENDKPVILPGFGQGPTHPMSELFRCALAYDPPSPYFQLSASAQKQLGYRFQYAVDEFPEDQFEAARFYRLGLELGDWECSARLSELLRPAKNASPKTPEQQNLWQDAVAARTFYKDSFEQNKTNPLAACRYALSVYWGVGGDQDEFLASTLLLSVASSKFPPVMKALGSLSEFGEGNLSKDPSIAVLWYSQAADRGYADAMCAMGSCYEKGIGRKVDLTTAARWYKAAAEYGFSDAECNYGAALEEGRGIRKSPVEAFYWYGRAAQQGDMTAQFNLACCYETGLGIEKPQPELALIWYQRSAQQGDIEANRKAANLIAKTSKPHKPQRPKKK